MIPTWMMVLARDWLFNKSTSGLAESIRESDPAAVVALQKFREGAPFMEIVKAYAAATSNKDDDQVVEILMTMPFKDVLAVLGGPLAAVHIPDGDGDPTNDITIGDALSRVVDKVVDGQ